MDREKHDAMMRMVCADGFADTFSEFLSLKVDPMIVTAVKANDIADARSLAKTTETIITVINKIKTEFKLQKKK